LAAHPDDETLGCGATISKLSGENNFIELLTFTDGVSSRFDGRQNRNTKLEKVSEILGISKFNNANFPDNSMDSIPLLEICKFIESKITYQPDVIFTHFHGDLNVDHQVVTKAVLTVFRPQYGHKMKIYSYYVPSSTEYNPTYLFDGNTYIQVSDVDVSNKIKALSVYDEEMREFPHPRSYQNVENLMKTWGCEVGLLNCEKFKTIREIL
jgi:LmbE family N-acetylglucosaminyl deacetylase